MLRRVAAFVLSCLWTVPACAITAAHLKVGGVTLTRCIVAYDGYCGGIVRPLDPAHRIGGMIAIGFEFYPRTDLHDPRQGVIVPQEGGPGYATTGSRDGYVRLFAPLRAHRDILLIDARGTGRSGAIDCSGLRRDNGLQAVRACGRQLGRTAWLYGSDFAADDMAAVLQALATGPVDYYGDSYGTFFGQVFAVRHPELVRSMVLDSAYPVRGGDVFFQTETENGPAAFALVCARSPACRALGGDARARFAALVDSLRGKPVSGGAPGADGEMRHVTADAAGLFTIVANAGNSDTAHRDIDAAGRAWRDAGDPLPLLRLVAEAIDGVNLGGAPADFSTGLALAVQCADYPQLYDMGADEGVRRAQFAARLAETEAKSPALYAPFGLREAMRAPADPQGLDLCQAWPRAPRDAEPARPVRLDAEFPAVPVLVLAGELDTVTSPIEGQRTARLFPASVFVTVLNAIHETAIGNGGAHVPPFGGDLARCVGPMVLAFIESHGAAPDTSCLGAIRPVRPVPAFAAQWQNVAPAAAAPGNLARRPGLTLASAVTETVGDAVARYGVMSGDTCPGLRGGHFTLTTTTTGYAFDLKDLKWTDDLSVSGRIVWNQFSGDIAAEVRFVAPGHAGTLRISWNDRQRDAQVLIHGQIDGATIVASRIAP